MRFGGHPWQCLYPRCRHSHAQEWCRGGIGISFNTLARSPGAVGNNALPCFRHWVYFWVRTPQYIYVSGRDRLDLLTSKLFLSFSFNIYSWVLSIILIVLTSPFFIRIFIINKTTTNRSGHAALATNPEWRDGLLKIKADLNTSHIRFHGILELVEFTKRDEREEEDDDDEGRESGGGTLPFDLDFTRVDAVYDWMIRTAGVLPYVELSFMPLPLASGFNV